MKVALKIAARFLGSSRGQTILIILGIAIGVSVQIFIGSLIDGLQRSLVDKTIGSASHVTIVTDGEEKDMALTDVIMDTLRGDEELTAVSPVYDSPGFVTVDEDASAVLIRGLNLQDADNIYKFSDNMISGTLPEADGDVIIGKEFSENTGLKDGDSLSFVTAQGQPTELNVTGVFDLKVVSINKSWLVSPIDTVTGIFDKAGRYTSMEMQVQTPFDADDISARIGALLPSGLEATDWKSQNAQLLSALSGQSASSYMIQVFVLLAVLLGISSVLAISVVQKSRQIGILKAMGIKDRTASLIFLLQGLILGVIGAVIGTGIGIGLSYAFSTFVQNPDGTPLVPFFLDAGFIGISVLIAVLSAMFAALIPARKSSRLNPIEVIRNG